MRVMFRMVVTVVPLTAALWGCGEDDHGGGLGEEADLRMYRDAITPIVEEVSSIDSIVAARAYNSAGTLATAKNLNDVFVGVRPQLLETLVALDRIEPPVMLLAMHEQIRALIVLRLDAYALVMDGYTRQDESLYQEAEEKLADANALISGLNDRLCAIDRAIDATFECRLLA